MGSLQFLDKEFCRRRPRKDFCSSSQLCSAHSISLCLSRVCPRFNCSVFKTKRLMELMLETGASVGVGVGGVGAAVGDAVGVGDGDAGVSAGKP